MARGSDVLYTIMLSHMPVDATPMLGIEHWTTTLNHIWSVN